MSTNLYRTTYIEKCFDVARIMGHEMGYLMNIPTATHEILSIESYARKFAVALMGKSVILSADISIIPNFVTNYRDAQSVVDFVQNTFGLQDCLNEFDNDELCTVVFNYYGGGGARILEINIEVETIENITMRVANMICDSMSDVMGEKITPQTLVLIEY